MILYYHYTLDNKGKSNKKESVKRLRMAAVLKKAEQTAAYNKAKEMCMSYPVASFSFTFAQDSIISLSKLLERMDGLDPPHTEALEDKTRNVIHVLDHQPYTKDTDTIKLFVNQQLKREETTLVTNADYLLALKSLAKVANSTDLDASLTHAVDEFYRKNRETTLAPAQYSDEMVAVKGLLGINYIGGMQTHTIIDPKNVVHHCETIRARIVHNIIKDKKSGVYAELINAAGQVYTPMLMDQMYAALYEENTNQWLAEFRISQADALQVVTQYLREVATFYQALSAIRLPQRIDHASTAAAKAAVPPPVPVVASKDKSKKLQIKKTSSSLQVAALATTQAATPAFTRAQDTHCTLCDKQGHFWTKCPRADTLSHDAWTLKFQQEPPSSYKTKGSVPRRHWVDLAAVCKFNNIDVAKFLATTPLLTPLSVDTKVAEFDYTIHGKYNKPKPKSRNY